MHLYSLAASLLLIHQLLLLPLLFFSLLLLKSTITLKMRDPFLKITMIFFCFTCSHCVRYRYSVRYFVCSYFTLVILVAYSCIVFSILQLGRLKSEDREILPSHKSEEVGLEPGFFLLGL